MILAFDIGGTKILGALFDEQMNIVQTQKWSANADDSLDHFIVHLKKCIAHLLTPDTIAICLGLPSVIDDGKIIRSTHIPCLHDVDLKTLLEKEFDMSIFMNNDANCFALAASNHFQSKNTVGVTLGTGLGVGLVFNGELYSGVTQGAGEIWQLTYENSVLEDYVASPFFSQKNIDPITIKHMPIEKQQKLFDEYAQHIAQLLSIVIFAYNPESIVIGGSLANLNSYYEKRALTLLRKKIPEQLFLKTTVIFWKESTAGVLGAALLSKLY